VRIRHDRLKLGDEDDQNPRQGHARNFGKTYGAGKGFDDESGHGTEVAGAVIHTAPWANIVNVKIYQSSLFQLVSALGDIVAEHKQRKSDKVCKQKSPLTILRDIKSYRQLTLQ
jgi:hypothetical protein